MTDKKSEPGLSTGSLFLFSSFNRSGRKSVSRSRLPHHHACVIVIVQTAAGKVGSRVEHLQRHIAEGQLLPSVQAYHRRVRLMTLHCRLRGCSQRASACCGIPLLRGGHAEHRAVNLHRIGILRYKRIERARMVTVKMRDDPCRNAHLRNTVFNCLKAVPRNSDGTITKSNFSLFFFAFLSDQRMIWCIPLDFSPASCHNIDSHFAGFCKRKGVPP